jgi:hypothetical protein
MRSVILLLDVSPNPVGGGSGVLLILLLGIILFLAAAFAGGLVFLLIWLKRRKMRVAGMRTEAG